MNILDKVKEILTKWNTQGLMIPLLRDPIKNRASFTATFYFTSFAFATLALIGKLTKYIEITDYNNCLYLYGLSASMYLGRSFHRDGKNIEVSAGTEEKEEKND